MNIRSHRDVLCGAGHARAVWVRPDDAEHRSVWRRWLKALATIVLAGFAVLGTAALPSLNGSRERLAALDRPEAPALRSGHATTNITQQHGQDEQ
jgi:hypothetical protein